MLDIKNANINYKRDGDPKKQPVVFLHGWGQNIEMMEFLGNAFAKTNDVIIFDLPGFGLSEEPPFAWDVTDYSECINDCLIKLKVKNPILVGHSFGGKISLMFASKYEVKKLVLLASPFKKGIEKQSLKLKVLKSLKKVPIISNLEEFAKKRIGSTDYKNASLLMRDVLVKTVNCDISEEVKKIKCPTIIIWGTNDNDVSIDSAYELEQLIEDAAVIVYENCTHYAYLENLEKTISIIDNFIRE